MSERSGYNPGEFCWVDLTTKDIDAAAAFYGDLIGWEFRPAGPPEETGGYGFFYYRDKMVAGGGPLQDPNQPPAWSSFVTVADAAATAARVEEAGGLVALAPSPLPMDAGLIAVLQDAEGAFINIIQPGRHAGAELVNEVGSWTWNQLGTRDMDKAASFYGQVFGWRAEKSPGVPDDVPYFMWHVDGQAIAEGLAGLNLIGPELPENVPPHWTVFFAVADAQQAVGKTEAAGGRVLLGPMEVPVGTMAVMLDPQGAEVAILQPRNPEER